MERPKVDFPQPDSPTRPKVLLLAISRLTSLTALTVVLRRTTRQFCQVNCSSRPPEMSVWDAGSTPLRKHATRPPPPVSSSAGSSSRHLASTFGQRSANRQPCGRSASS